MGVKSLLVNKVTVEMDSRRLSIKISGSMLHLYASFRKVIRYSELARNEIDRHLGLAFYVSDIHSGSKV